MILTAQYARRPVAAGLRPLQAQGALAAVSSHDKGLSALPSSSDAPAAQPEEELATDDVCPGCEGWGALTCPACDGTGRWTEASESAGLYQGEAARALGHCAWCNEWGEVECPDCEGLGFPSEGMVNRRLLLAFEKSLYLACLKQDPPPDTHGLQLSLPNASP